MTLPYTKSLSIVWGALTGLTILAWWLSAPHAPPLDVNAAVTVGVLGMSLIKCRLIMRHFMEVRTAPRNLRLFSEIWLIGLFGTIAAAYLFGPAWSR